MDRQVHFSEIAIAFCVSSAFALAFYSPILLSPQIYDFRDMPRVLLPFEHMVRQLLLTDALPLWNFMGGLGKPLFADPLSGLSYPPQYLFRLLPEPLGWNASIAVHHVLAFLGAFLFLRRASIGRAGSYIGACVFAFGGYLVSTDNMLNALQSVTWFPWALWAYLGFFDGGNFRRTFIPSAMFISLTFLGGMPEVVGYELAIMALLALFPVGVKNPLHMVLRCFSFFTLTILSFALSAVSFLPLYDFLSLSTRSNGLQAQAITELSFAPQRIVEFLYPFRFLQTSDHTPWLLSATLGPAIVFVFPAFFFASNKARALLVLFAGMFFLAAMGGFLPGYHALVERYEILRVARHPEKFLLVPHAVLSLAIGFGYHALFGAKFSRPGHALMVAIVFSSLWLLGRDIHPLMSWEKLIAKPATYAPLDDLAKPVRIDADGVGPSVQPELVDIAEVQQRLFLHHYGLFHDINNVNAPSSLNLRSAELLTQFIEQAGPDRLVNHLALFSISHVTSTQSLAKVDELIPLGHAGKVNIFGVPNPRPRMYLPKNIYIASNALEVGQLLTQVAQYPEDAVVLSNEHPAGWLKVSGKLNTFTFSGDTISFEAQMKTAGFVVINDAFHPSWSVRCEEECEAKLFQANGFVRGVFLPPGLHRVFLEYKPGQVYFGLILSGMLWLIVVLLVVAPSTRKTSRH